MALRSYIDLARTLTWREVVVRFKRSYLGIVWALFDPAAHVIIYVAVFGAVLDAGRGLQSYALYTVLGVLPWLFLSMTVEQASGVLLEHANLIRKIAFPFELLVVAVVLSRLTSMLVGLLVAFLFAVGLEVSGGASISWASLVWLPLGLAPLLVIVAGLALASSALQVVFADAQFLIRFALRVFFYACPIIYPITRVPTRFQGVFELNPLVAILWCFQALSDPSLPPPSMVSWLAALVGTLLFGAGGWALFSRLRRTVAELV